MVDVFEQMVRETSTTSGFSNFVLGGAMYGSLAFSQVMANGDTCDYIARYGEQYEEGFGTYVSSSNTLVRTGVYRSRHIGGTTNNSLVNFAAGVKVIAMTYAAYRAKLVTGAVLFSVPQSLNSVQQAQARANAPPFATGVRMIFNHTSAPVGWTKETAYNDFAMRIVSGTVTAAGSVNFSTLFARTSTDAVTLSQTHLPVVNFTVTGVTQALTCGGTTPYAIPGTPGGTATAFGPNFLSYQSGVFLPLDNSGGLSVSGTASSGGAATPFVAGVDMRVKYMDVIIAQMG